MAAQLERPSRVERLNPKKALDTAANITKKPITMNFVLMCIVAGILDIIGLFTNELPGVGIVISIIADVIFIPWFYFSGIKFNSKRIASMLGMNIVEDIPIIGNFPFIILNVIYSYYSN